MSAAPFIALSQTDAAIAQVVMLPHAGGTPQTYASWAALFPDEIALLGAALPQPTGRDGQQAFTLQKLAADIADALAQLPPLPTALYGHSMGAMLAYALAAEMKARGAPAFLHISVSASRPPHVPLKRRRMHTLADAEFLRELQKLGGTPEQVMREGDLMAARLPVMRAHFRALESYVPFSVPAPEHVLETGILSYGGMDDHLDEADIAAWAHLTRGDFACAMLDGGHFFNRVHAPQIAKGLRVAVFKAIARGASAAGAHHPSASRSAHA